MESWYCFWLGRVTHTSQETRLSKVGQKLEGLEVRLACVFEEGNPPHQDWRKAVHESYQIFKKSRPGSVPRTQDEVPEREKSLKSQDVWKKQHNSLKEWHTEFRQKVAPPAPRAPNEVVPGHGNCHLLFLLCTKYIIHLHYT
jgi:hypothetical protein